MFEHIKDDLKRRLGNLCMRRPRAEVLIGSDAGREHVFVDIGKIDAFGRGDFLCGRLVHVDARFPVGAHEGLRHVGLQPFAGRRQAREPARADQRAGLRHHMANTVCFELLRERSLLLDVFADAGAEGGVDIGGPARMDQVDLVHVDPGLVAGIFEHRERLPAAERDDIRALKLVPGKILVFVARRDEEPVHLVDLRKMHDARHFALRQRTEALAQRRLHDMGGAVFESGNRGHAGRRDRPFGLQPFFLQKTCGERGNQRRIKCRKQGELDVDLGHERCPFLARIRRCGTSHTGRLKTTGTELRTCVIQSPAKPGLPAGRPAAKLRDERRSTYGSCHVHHHCYLPRTGYRCRNCRDRSVRTANGRKPGSHPGRFRHIPAADIPRPVHDRRPACRVQREFRPAGGFSRPERHGGRAQDRPARHQYRSGDQPSETGGRSGA